MTFQFLSMCSGIEAASVAFGPLGWKARGFAEIEAFPSAVLAHHYPTTPNFGDMTAYRDWPEAVFEDTDIVVGGPPCQAFSVAGLRRSLDDARGNLTLTYVELLKHADTIRARRGRPPVAALYENVPGLLSTKDNAFGCFLAGLAGEDEPLVPAGDRWTDAGVVYGPERAVAWRTLDAQYFGVAQRRRRVFVLAFANAAVWPDPAEVLLEFEGVRRDSAPCRESWEKAAAAAGRSLAGGGVAGAGHLQLALTDHDIVGARTSACGPNGHGGSGLATDKGAEAGHILPVMFGGNNTSGPIDTAPALNANRGCHNPGDFEAGALLVEQQAYGFQPRIARNGRGDMGEVINALTAQAGETGKGDAAPCVAVRAVSFPGNLSGTQAVAVDDDGTTSVALGAKNPTTAVALAFKAGQSEAAGGTFVTEEFAPTLQAQNNGSTAVPAVLAHMQVRRLTPVECERLQGFPDHYTAIAWRGKPASECPDGPRYKALGNSWAVPNVRWIGRRIDRALKELCIDLL